MSDLINRQEAIDVLKERLQANGYSNVALVSELNRSIGYLMNLPSVDAVEVVRCKDCEWWDRIDDGLYGYCHACKHGFYSANWEISIYRRYKEDFFCADGERRTDE